MKIYIANLSKIANSADIWDKFSEIGIVKEVEIVRSAELDKGKDFAIIQLDSFPERLAKINAAANTMQQMAKNQTARQAS
ncbi:MAG: RNA-binding protein [Sphingobacteriales bacterium]|nr:MAG: RNA-binding protein [Sphingobacteriales bacterium]